MNSIHSLKLISASSRVAPTRLRLDFTSDYSDVRTYPSPSSTTTPASSGPPSPRHATPPRKLRRLKHISISQVSAASKQGRVTVNKSRRYPSQQSLISEKQSTTTTPYSSRASTPLGTPSEHINLGHPCRPYYTTVRKNGPAPFYSAIYSHHGAGMSLASSLSATTTSPRPTPLSSIYTNLSRQHASCLDPDESDLTPVFSRECTASPLGFLRQPIGFSLSGETELRMALAAADGQLRRQVSRERPTGYAEHLLRGITRLGRGLRSLLGARHSHSKPF